MKAHARGSLVLLGGFFVAAGVLHFLRPVPYERIVPPYLPAHRTLVFVSGIAEIAGGAGLFFRRTRRVAGIGLILLLLAVWPANFEMLFHARAARKPFWWELLLWARLPLQVLLMIWVWRASRSERHSRAPASKS